MPTFNITTVGDVDFLEKILNSVAMICGTGDFKQLCICGFILGILFICFQCIFQGAQRINLQQTFVGFLCYMLFFGPSCTVVLEDAQGTGEHAVVDNVPLGVGAAGMAISGIGLGLSNMMEQAFGSVYRTHNFAYTEPLQILVGMRGIGTGPVIWGAIDKELCGATGQNCNSRQAVINYIAECVAPDIQMAKKTPEQIFSESVSLSKLNNSILASQNKALMTMLPISEGAGGKLVGEDGYLICSEAWSTLKTNVFAKIRSGNVGTALNNQLGIGKSKYSNLEENGWSIANSVFENLGMTGTAMQDYVTASILEPVYMAAAHGFYRSQMDIASAIAVQNAMQQRDTQWAAEQTMFAQVARPLMSFFEGFVYAVTPIMGFLLMIGGFGLSLIGKYFMILAWMQLWLPCMTICNLYTMTAASRAIQKTAVGGMSFYASNEVAMAAQHYVGIGGMLFAASPMLALFLVSGSMYAFTTLTNRLSGQDHFNEKAVNPDAVQVSPVMTIGANQNFNRSDGNYRVGSENIDPTFSAQNALSNAITRSEADVKSASVGTRAALSEMYSSGTSSATMNQLNESIAKNASGSVMVEGKSVYDHAHAWGEKHGFTAEQVDQALAKAAVTAKGGASINLSIVKGGIEVQKGTQDTTTHGDKTSISTDESDSFSVSFSKADSAKFSQATETAIGRTDSKTFNALAQENRGTAHEKTFALQASRNQQLSEAKNAQASIGAGNSAHGRQIAHGLKTRAAQGDVDAKREQAKVQDYKSHLSTASVGDQPSEKSKFVAEGNRWSRALGVSQDEGETIAYAERLQATGQWRELNALAQSAGAPLISQSGFDYSAPERLGADTITGEVENQQAGALDAVNAGRDQIAGDGNVITVQNSADTITGTGAGFYGSSIKQVESDANATFGKLEAKTEQTKQDTKDKLRLQNYKDVQGFANKNTYDPNKKGTLGSFMKGNPIRVNALTKDQTNFIRDYALAQGSPNSNSAQQKYEDSKNKIAAQVAAAMRTNGVTDEKEIAATQRGVVAALESMAGENVKTAEKSAGARLVGSFNVLNGLATEMSMKDPSRSNAKKRQRK